jgi:hypothetical protein
MTPSDIEPLELFDMTVSQAVLDVQKQLDARPGQALCIVMDDETHRRNVVKLLNKYGRTFNEQAKGALVTIDVDPMKVLKKPPVLTPVAVPRFSTQAEQAQAPPPPAQPLPVLILSCAVGGGDKTTGRRLLIEILRRADRSIPWVGVAFEGASLLRDPDGLKALRGLNASGVKVRVSRECAMFNADESAGFDVMEDSEWHGLLLKGKVTKF